MAQVESNSPQLTSCDGNGNIIEEIPDEFICPVSRELMLYPAQFDDKGKCYDLSTLLCMIKESSESTITLRDPCTNLPVYGCVKINFKLKNKIEQWIEEHKQRKFFLLFLRFFFVLSVFDYRTTVLLCALQLTSILVFAICKFVF